MPAKPNATVCGVPARLGGAVHYGGGHITTGVGRLGHWRSISKPGARRLMKALFGHERLPRPGHEVKLCDDQYLESMSGSLQVVRRASGEMRGGRRARRRHVRQR